MQDKLNHSRTRTRGKSAGRGWLLKLLVCTAIIFFAVTLAWRYLAFTLFQVNYLSRQEVSRFVTVEGVLIKDEKVVRSPAAGKVQYIVSDGKRLEVGARAAHVIASEQDYSSVKYDVHTPKSGIFSRHMDGLENILVPANLDVLEIPRIDKIVDKPLPETPQVEKGQPIFKIIDNHLPLIMLSSLGKEHFSGLLDKQGWIQAFWENQPLLVKPNKKTEKVEGWEVFFLLSGYPEDLLHHRKVSISVTAEKLRGFLVPDRAIVYKNGEPGIYLVFKKKAQWTSVKIEGALEGQVSVSGKSLKEGAPYVNNPVLVREGWKVE